MRTWTVLFAILMLLVILGSGLACAGLGCPAGSTWSCDCYNFYGEYVGHASGNGCGCDCGSVSIWSRVVNCNVYKPQE